MVKIFCIFEVQINFMANTQVMKKKAVELPGPYAKERTEALEKATVTPLQMEMAEKAKLLEEKKKAAKYRTDAMRRMSPSGK